jgi:hypothetical protein
MPSKIAKKPETTNSPQPHFVCIALLVQGVGAVGIYQGDVYEGATQGRTTTELDRRPFHRSSEWRYHRENRARKAVERMRILGIGDNGYVQTHARYF